MIRNAVKISTMKHAMYQGGAVLCIQKTHVEANLSTVIYDKIKDDIIEMRRLPDSFVLERQVAAEYETSRTPVREALKRLMQEGWLVGEDRRRLQVSQLTLAYCYDAFAVRTMIEKHAIREIFARGETRSLAGKLDAEMRKMDALKDDAIAMVRADLGFHTVIVEHLDNLLLTRVWRSISDEIARIVIFAMDEERHPDVILKEHRKIVEALWDQQTDIITSLDAHMNGILQGIERTFEQYELTRR
ncbi:GntR family transcriptional regulator [Synergistaceae bacterium OttesenSCG-928-D05]|nr:GntR family transcriptional regulator [Synergistaceae bacterium OttesenSCG-928-D05]